MRNIEIATNEYYHVFNRGVGKQVIFHDMGDYTRMLFLILHFQFSDKVEHLSRVVKEFSRSIGKFGQHSVLATNESKRIKSVELVSFCIMPNHFHLLLKEMEEDGKGISAYMHRLLNAYGKYYNAKYLKSGHVFQGPYKAVLMEDDVQLMHLSAYIHLNPRELSEWKDRERQYPWSSYQDYLSIDRWGAFLEKDIIMGRYSRKEEYEDFVKSSLAKLTEEERLAAIS